MPTNEFLPFATGAGALVQNQPDYFASVQRASGFTAGIAEPAKLNKVWRQSSFVSAALADFIVAKTGLDVKDDGDLAGFVGLLTAAVQSAAALGFTPVNKAGDTMTGALTLAADPTDKLHAATKQYVDNVAQGLNVKGSARVATTANITLSGTQTIDGVAVVAGDRVLVMFQTAPAQNGVYVVAAGAWTRATDMDAWSKVPGAFVFVAGGTANAKTGWACTSAAGGTLGTTAINFTQFSGAGAYTASGGINLSGVNFTLADMAQARIKGRAAGAGSGAPQDLTGAQVQAIVLPAQTGNAGKTLTTDGSAAAWSGDLTPKAWGRFIVSGGVATLVKGYNVSSVTRMSSGHYRATWTAAMPDADYSIVAMCKRSGTGIMVEDQDNINTPLAGYMACVSVSGGYVEASFVSFVVFG